MTLETLKIDLVQRLLQTDQVDVLQKIKDLLNAESQDWWHNLSEDEKHEIELGLQDADNDKFISNTDALKRFSKWH